MLKWFMPSWYEYLFSKPYGYRKHPTWQMVWCRIKGHPRGTIYYNPGGTEPDGRCKDCGENIA